MLRVVIQFSLFKVFMPVEYLANLLNRLELCTKVQTV